MYRLVSRLILYKDEDSILFNLAKIFRKYDLSKKDFDIRYETISQINSEVGRIVELASKYGFSGDLWHDYLIYLLLSSENSLCVMFERCESGENLTIDEFMRNDLEVIVELMNYDFSAIEDELGINSFSMIRNFTQSSSFDYSNHNASGLICDVCSKVKAGCSVDELYSVIRNFYHKYGVGIYGLNKAFKLSHSNGDDFSIVPITSFDDSISLDDLLGYEYQKGALVDNTEAFIRGCKANNVLLYGDAGTGKSTSIKAILNKYYDDGLRIIEVYKHETKYLSRIISEIKDRNYFFILYMDDLSFEESESDYKYLKALIEGGLEITPDNILIYATSNRRHLVRETWNERSDTSAETDLYHSDTVREKLSLVDRFGITIGYYKPTFNEYVDIVISLARRYPEITLTDEELESEAKIWIRTHGHPSGRTAEQLVYYLLSKC